MEKQSERRRLVVNKRLTMKCIGFLLVVLLVFMGLDFMLYPCTFFRSDMNRVRTIPVQDLILGASHGKMDLSPEAMQEVNHRSGHNLSMGGEYPVDSYFLYREVLESGQKLERIIYVLSPSYFSSDKELNGNELLFFHEFPLSYTKLVYAAASIGKWSVKTLLCPWYQYFERYGPPDIADTIRRKVSQDYSADIFTSDTQEYHEDGFIERYPTDPNTFTYAGVDGFKEEELRENHLDYLERLILLAKEQGIEFVCVWPPLPGATLKHFKEDFISASEFFSDFFEKQEVPFLNFNDTDSPLFSKFTHKVNAFTDLMGHMHGDAACSFSRLLAKELS